MICNKVGIPKELRNTEGELKAIYHSKNTVFFLFLKIEICKINLQKTKGMTKVEQETVYQEYQS